MRAVRAVCPSGPPVRRVLGLSEPYVQDVSANAAETGEDVSSGEE